MADETRSSHLARSAREHLQTHEHVLKEINHKIWSNPELAYKEYTAHDSICALFESLKDEGYTVRRQAFGLDTSFEIEYSTGNGGRVVVFNAEYDALPEIGHACGHNLIATCSIAAFICAVNIMKDLGSGTSDAWPFTLRLLGTPAEEHGGGKIRMIDAGAYKGVDACLMAHPAGTMDLPGGEVGVAAPPPGSFLANQKVGVTYIGKPAHASATPWKGVNALDAAVTAYVNISVLRQQILPSQRIHGIISNGGSRPNIIPAKTTLDFDIRATDKKELETLVQRVTECFEAAAKATNCEVEFEWKERYLDLQSNIKISERYVAAMEALGRNVWLGGKSTTSSSGGSTDQGNVSYETPSFHAIFSIPTQGVHPHQAQFTEYAGAPEAHERCIDTGAGMAIVACEILTKQQLADQIRSEFSEISGL